VVLGLLLTAVAYTVWLERKVVGHMQNRWGPTRVGPFGLLQPAADGMKFLFKEDLLPAARVQAALHRGADDRGDLCADLDLRHSVRQLDYGLWNHYPLEITDVNIGLLIVLGVTSLGVYGVALAGWSSNNKYSLLGGLRASAQMVSYEISLGLSLVGVLIMAAVSACGRLWMRRAGHFWGFIPRWNIFYGAVRWRFSFT
jgi:NADH-quinone oxidoreductase subunit H